MRGINEKFDDDEFEFLREKKGDMSWHKFILKNAGYERQDNTIKKQDNTSTNTERQDNTIKKQDNTSVD